MFKLETAGPDYWRITGYPDGSDWLLTPGHFPLHAQGVAADDYI